MRSRHESLAPPVAAGLSHVHGVESGDPDDLKQFNKHLSLDKHLRAGEISRAAPLFRFGFMLFQPVDDRW
jgi:hypothetical protein